MGRSYTLGLAIGSLWLIVAAVGFSVTVLALMDIQAATVVLAAVLAVAVVVATAAVFVIKAAARLPRDTASAKSGPTMRRWFIIVFAVEVVLIVVVAWVCAATRRFEYIVPLDRRDAPRRSHGTHRRAAELDRSADLRLLVARRRGRPAGAA